MLYCRLSMKQSIEYIYLLINDYINYETTIRLVLHRLNCGKSELIVLIVINAYHHGI